jgi:hypothetical protein
MHIMQEYINAPILTDVWDKLGPDERRSCMDQLKNHLAQLRALTPPEPDKAQTIDGTGCVDDRLHPGVWEPFHSIDVFNAFFGHGIVRQRAADYPDAQNALAKTHGRIWIPTAIWMLNILCKDGRIVAIVDCVLGGSRSIGSIRGRTLATKFELELVGNVSGDHGLPLC